MKQLLALFLLPIALFAQPVYNTQNPIDVGPGIVITVWNAETPTPGNGTTAASQQVSLHYNGFGVDGKFSGAPGAFEVDLQVASSDSDTSYQTCSNCNITTVDSTNNTFHIDAALVRAKYARLLMRSRGNSVSITASITGG